jgi:hypothetical protein
VLREPSDSGSGGVEAIITVSCTFSSPTTNGGVPGSHVNCTQQ